MTAIKPLAIILVGLPGSGKTTFREEQVKLNPEYKVVSSDDFIEKVAEDTNKRYSDCFANNIKKAEEAMYEQVDIYTFEEHSFIWDQTNLTKKKRKKIFELIPKCVYDIRCIVFNTDDATIDKRVAKRKDKKIPKGTMISMRKGFEYPTEDEGFNMVMEIS